MQTTTLVSAECFVEWDSDAARHRDWRWFPKIDFSRELIPGDLAGQMLGASGELAAARVLAGDGIPLTRRDARCSLKRAPVDAAFQQRHLHGPYRGRFYPRGVLSTVGGVGSVFNQDLHPFRVTHVDDDQVAVDLGHPLAGYPLTVGGRIREHLRNKELRGGSCSDLVADLTVGGSGMQCAPLGGSVDFTQPDAFNRADREDDAVFYQQPRRVHHIDSRARNFINEVYRRNVRPGERVLDLMSSWVSHLDGINGDASVIGLGMNGEELQDNDRLADYVVHDLNRDPRLPWPGASFDVVVSTVSVEYLTRPYEVFAEVARVLTPGGRFVVTFSDRWFPPKVIRLWTVLHPFERMGLVLDYFRRGRQFSGLGTESWSGWPRPENDKYFGKLLNADPVYAVWGERV